MSSHPELVNADPHHLLQSFGDLPIWQKEWSLRADQMDVTLTLDELDRAILRELQADGRVSNLQLARRIGLSAPATHARVRRLEREGVIRGYVALLDREQVGYDLLCLISVSIQLHQYEHVERFRALVREMPEVLECHHLTGEYDYVLKVALHNRRDLERFVVERLTPIPGVQRIHTSLVLSEVKSTTALPIPDVPATP